MNNSVIKLVGPIVANFSYNVASILKEGGSNVGTIAGKGIYGSVSQTVKAVTTRLANPEFLTNMILQNNFPPSKEDVLSGLLLGLYHGNSPFGGIGTYTGQLIGGSVGNYFVPSVPSEAGKNKKSNISTPLYGTSVSKLIGGVLGPIVMESLIGGDAEKYSTIFNTAAAVVRVYDYTRSPELTALILAGFVGKALTYDSSLVSKSNKSSLIYRAGSSVVNYLTGNRDVDIAARKADADEDIAKGKADAEKALRDAEVADRQASLVARQAIATQIQDIAGALGDREANAQAILEAKRLAEETIKREKSLRERIEILEQTSLGEITGATGADDSFFNDESHTG